MKTPSPIALFVYNRLDLTRQTVEALKHNALADNSDLFIFSDGPKGVSDQKVEDVRKYIKNISGFKSVTVVEREKNLGLAASIIAGVTDMVNRFGTVIVVEDDLVTSPYFLSYMNQGLNMYEAEEKVASIHGYVYPVTKKLPETFFIRGADCWGWATWKRAWQIFESDGQNLLDQLTSRRLEKDFDFDGMYPYTEMLRGQIAGRNNSWAIRWYASAFLKDMLTLYPGVSFVKNIGFDGSGTHSKSSYAKTFKTDLVDHEFMLKKIPVKESVAGREVFIDYFKKNRPSPYHRFKIRLFALLSSKIKRYGPLRRIVKRVRHIIRDYTPSGPLKEKMPWFTSQAVNWLRIFLTKEMDVFEWGSGGSTLFVAARAKHLVSIEHNYEWFLKTRSEIKHNRLHNVDYRCVEAGTGISPEYGSTDKNYLLKNFELYVRSIEKYPDNHFDLIIIDGRARTACIKKSVSKLKPGGYILLDNAERPEYHEGIVLLGGFTRTDFESPGSLTSIFRKPG